MKSLAVSAFKARCIAELKRLQQSGEELVITLRGRPVARVLPIRNGCRQLGAQAGSMEIVGDLVSSDLDEDFAPAEARRVARRKRT
jgi:antitoxin (DNA-binding transcriptional repressor) of toxin-antitoxin stability system